MFKLVEGQTVTVRQSLEFYPRPEDDNYMVIIDGPVTVKIVDICSEPNADWSHYNVDIEVMGNMYAGTMINIDIEEDDIES